MTVEEEADKVRIRTINAYICITSYDDILAVIAGVVTYLDLISTCLT